MRFAGINFLLILLMAGVLNLIVDQGWPLLKKTAPTLPALIGGIGLLVPFADSRLFQVVWLFLKTGLLSFGGAYASLVFVQRGAVAQYHWLSDGQLLDGVALSVATPGPFLCCLPHSSDISPAELLERSWLRSLCSCRRLFS